MPTLIGLLIVFGAVIGGYLMAGGPLGVLIQPNELVVIGGAALGTLVISSPGAVGKRVVKAFKSGFAGSSPKPAEYLDLLKLMFDLFQLMRRDGVLALETHIAEPTKSSLFSKYPSVTARHHAMSFLLDGLKQLLDGCPIADLQLLFDAELETHHEQEHQPIGLIKSTGDALPGLGIVAAVLGIVITMGHIGGPPAEIGHHVAAALVGTFLGILLCYGVLGPIATSVEIQTAANTRYLLAIKEGLLAAARGSNPQLALEFARRPLFEDERPDSRALEAALAAAKKA